MVVFAAELSERILPAVPVVVVATPYAYPPALAEYASTLPAEIGVDVESPVPPPEPVMVIGLEPSVVNWVQVTLPEHVTVVVATPNTPAPPLETRRLELAGWDVVASPTQLTVLPVRMFGGLNVSGCSGVYPKIDDEAIV